MPDSFFAHSASGKRKRARPAREQQGRKPGKPSRGGKAAGSKGKGKRKARTEDSEDEDSESDDVGDGGFDSDVEIPSAGEQVYSDDYESERETPAQKRLRLAKAYLDKLNEAERREDGVLDAAEVDRELISARLQRDVAETGGRLHAFIASRLPSTSSFSIFRTGRNHHRLPVTSAVASSDGRYLYAAEKSGTIVKYDMAGVWSRPATSDTAVRKVAVMGRAAPAPDGEKRNKGKAKARQPGVSKATEAQHGHVGEVLSIAVSGDGKILASGGTDRLVGVWDVGGEGAVWRSGLRGHKDTIASIAFRLGTASLFTSSYDRTLKIFELDSLSYSETLFGHQDRIHSISALRNELAVSAGGRDRTCRYWKIADESQLVFRGGGQSKMRDLLEGAAASDDEEVNDRGKKRPQEKRKYVEGSVDCVAMVDDSTFLSGGDSGTIALWSTGKKKPVFSAPLSHGLDMPDRQAEIDVGVVAKPRWVTALGCLAYGDVFASGSWDGSVKLWRIADDRRSFSSIGDLAVTGCVNSLQVVKHVSKTPVEGGKPRNTEHVAIVVGVGQEPRLGRFMRIREARNGVMVATAELGQAATVNGGAPRVNGFH